MDLFNKKALAAAQAALANAEAKVYAQEKKTKSAMIIGGSTTAVAAALGAFAHFGLGQGRKLNRDKIKNYDQVVEERDRVIGEKNKVEAALKEENAMKMIAIGDADNLVNAINSRDPEYMVKAKDDHKRFRKEIYGDATTDSLRTSIELFNKYVEQLEKADTAEKKDAAETAEKKDAAETAEKKDADDTDAAKKKVEESKKAEAIKNAEAVRNAACQKANELNTAYEAAKTAHDAIANDATKSADEKAAAKKTMDDAKTALDAAEAEFKKAEQALKALQNNG